MSSSDFRLASPVWVAGALAFAATALWAQSGRGGPQEVEVPPREPALETFPCQECHVSIDEQGTGVAPRTRTHAGLRFAHMEKIEQCRLCHWTENMNKLVLVDGRPVGFNESYRLCGQCHGEKLRDWLQNLHGKQVGSWRGIAHRYSCVDCHDPHTPRLNKIKAQPAPLRPKFSIPKGDDR